MTSPIDDRLSGIEVAVRTWSDFAATLAALPDTWLLRGQREAYWNLATTLERHAPEDRPRAEAEETWCREFKRSALQYLRPQLVPIRDLEWLALMQHHGAPTRLLDFTRSPYVAAYFALEDKGIDDRCAVWAVERVWCWQAAGKALIPRAENTTLVQALKRQSVIGDDPQRLAAGLVWSVAHLPNNFQTAVLRANPTIAIPMEPNRLSERLTVQQGTFVCAGNIQVPFIDNLTAMDGWEENVRKFTLPFSERPRALQELRKMNITRASLFPGLDGYAQSFRNLLEREPKEQRNIRLAIEGLEHAIRTSGIPGSPRNQKE